jgi:NAD(P)-dependent dehydrogenase (short-subunit alcohol dehydrogenase family)
MEAGMARLPRFDLKDKVVMVTGAAGGIGSEIVRACAEAGADVVLTDRDIPQLAEVAAQIETDRRAICLPFDLLDVQAIREGAAEAFRRMGRIDGLVNCAGTNVYRLALEVPEKEWDLIVGVNLKGLFFLSQVVAREMVERKQKGRIVNIASTSGLRGGDHRSVYCASKGGVVQLTRAMAIELAPHGINVNAVAPTFTATPINREMLEDQERKAQILSSIPAGRLGRPMDTAAAIVFLLSEAADFITGHVLAVDGGRLAI